MCTSRRAWLLPKSKGLGKSAAAWPSADAAGCRAVGIRGTIDQKGGLRPPVAPQPASLPGPPTATSTRSLWRSASTWRPCGSMSPLTIQEPQTHQGVLPASAAPALHPPPCSRASHAICHHGVLTLSRGRHRQCRQSPSDRRDACRRCCCLHRAFSGHCCIALCINRGPLGVHSLGDEGGVWSLWRSWLSGSLLPGWPTRLRRGRDVVRAEHTLPRRWTRGEAGGVRDTWSS